MTNEIVKNKIHWENKREEMRQWGYKQNFHYADYEDYAQRCCICGNPKTALIGMRLEVYCGHLFWSGGCSVCSRCAHIAAHLGMIHIFHSLLYGEWTQDLTNIARKDNKEYFEWAETYPRA